MGAQTRSAGYSPDIPWRRSLMVGTTEAGARCTTPFRSASQGWEARRSSWLQIPNVAKKYRTALTITGLVTFIATYHYFRIFNSWNDAFDVKFDDKTGDYAVSLTGAPFNDAYRYVDWILTVPLLLIELILVMGLPAEETVSKSWTLGVASAVMVALGYPGEI